MSTGTFAQITIKEVVEEVGINEAVLDKKCVEEDLLDLAKFCDPWKLNSNLRTRK